MTQPGTWNIESRTNSGKRFVVTWKPDGVLADLTGCSAKLQIRTAAGGTVVLTLTPGNGLTLGGALGTISVRVAQAVLAVLAVGVYVWDLVVTDTLGEPHCILGGKWNHQQGVTIP